MIQNASGVTRVKKIGNRDIEGKCLEYASRKNYMQFFMQNIRMVLKIVNLFVYLERKFYHYRTRKKYACTKRSQRIALSM